MVNEHQWAKQDRITIWESNTACWKINRLSIQWPFQDARLEVPTIYKAYFLGLCKGISPQNMDKYGLIWYSTSNLGSWNSHWSIVVDEFPSRTCIHGELSSFWPHLTRESFTQYSVNIPWMSQSYSMISPWKASMFVGELPLNHHFCWWTSMKSTMFAG